MWRTYSNVWWSPLALILGIALGGTSVWVGLSSPSTKQDNQANCWKGSTSKHCQNASDNVPKAIVSPISPDKPPPRDPKPDRKEWREESDLDAQWEMAQWAGIAVGVAFLTACITGVGVVYVKQTLDATRATVREAQRSSDAAMIAAEATRESVKYAARSVEVAANVERPFVYIKEIELRPVTPLMPNKDELFQPYFIFVNYGRTPAIVTRIGFHYLFGKRSEIPLKPAYSVDRLTSEVVIPPEGTYPFPVPCTLEPISVDKRRALSEFGVFHWLWGYIRYRDFLGGVSDIGFIARQQSEGITIGGRIIPTAFRFRGPAVYTYERYYKGHSEVPSNPTDIPD